MNTAMAPTRSRDDGPRRLWYWVIGDPAFEPRKNRLETERRERRERRNPHNRLENEEHRRKRRVVGCGEANSGPGGNK
jgi:hypothetical protein